MLNPAEGRAHVESVVAVQEKWTLFALTEEASSHGTPRVMAVALNFPRLMREPLYLVIQAGPDNDSPQSNF